MNSNAYFERLCTELTEFRRDLHAHPEIAFEERRTSNRIAEQLRVLGLDVDRGLAGTGVVGSLIRGDGDAIGLRADMDGLPLTERTGLAYASRYGDRMHACGHDGHSAMLLGAARFLTGKGRFRGTVHFIFQPAEENVAGGKRMVDEGLFERFPMCAVFGLHNRPGLEAGVMGVRAGPVMASADFFELRIHGVGGHAAYPHHAQDPILIGSQIIGAWQALISRGVDPLESVVLSVTRFRAGTTDNVIPSDAVLGGTVRSFRPSVQAQMENGMWRIAEGIAAAHGASVELDYEHRYRATVNDAEATATALRVMERTVGSTSVVHDLPRTMGAEDFGWMLAACPGAYVTLGNGTEGVHGRPLHNPGYDFNDAIIPVGVRFWVNLVRELLPEA